MADTPENYAGKPMWVRNQRNSFHGVDFPYHSALDIAEYYRRYAETLLAVDDSVGRVMALLRDRGLLDSTIVMFMGDNGFAFGEHGLIDKRTAYEASMRVPLLMSGGGLPAGTRVEEVVANIDIAPTILAAAGLEPPPMDGRNALPLARGERIPWRDTVLYGTTGSAISRRRRRCTRCAGRATNTSAITGSGIPTSCTICRPIRSRLAI